MRRILFLLRYGRCIPHLLLFHWSGQREVITADLDRWRSTSAPNSVSVNSTLVYTIVKFPEYRNLFYYRLKEKFRDSLLLYLAKFLYRPFSVLFLEHTLDIGPGLFIQHGTCSHVGARSIGRNCWINQQVTIGWRSPGKSPVIGDNVYVGSGAKVLGDITIGNNVRIGANAVVIKNVPDNCTVVGVPARVVKRNNIRIDTPDTRRDPGETG